MEVQVFYNPEIVGYTFFKQLYDGFGLSAPTLEEIKERQSESELPSGKKVKMGWTSFTPLGRSQAKRLVNLLLDFPLTAAGLRGIEVRPTIPSD